MRALVLFAMLAACGDNHKGRTGDAGIDASQGLRHCLDERDGLLQPPTGQLPCDLLPPGFGQ